MDRPEGTDDETLLQEHRALEKRMPVVWNAFFGGFRQLRPVQLRAMPEILSGADVLITAPTAGGKTEAALAPLCQRLMSERWSGLSVLVVTPTRALVNDLFARLERPLASLKLGGGRRTGEHGLSSDQKEQIVVTTPESLESMLTLRRGSLDNLRAIVIDEIHLLDASPRGDQLRCLLRRLRTYLARSQQERHIGLQTVAMSATVPDPERLAACYLGPQARLVQVTGQREVEAQILQAGASDEERAAAAVQALEAFPDVRKALVFVNSRQQVDAAAGLFQLGGFQKFPIYGHHGNLSKHHRENVEARFKNDEFAICVATMTLEVGIDIGDIDVVVCLDPPFSLASFLQRIGRGCRRLQGKTRVACVARNRGCELLFQALVRQSRLGIPRGPRSPFRRSVLIQQILAYLRQVGSHRRVREQFLRALSDEQGMGVSPMLLDSLLADMTTEGFLAIRSGVYEPAKEGRSFIESSRLFCNMAPPPRETTVVDADSGRPIGRVRGIDTAVPGVAIAGKNYELLGTGPGGAMRVRTGDVESRLPEYDARSLPYAYDIGVALRDFLGVAESEWVVISRGDALLVMTWFGRLYNAAFAESLKRAGVRATSGSFHVAISGVDLGELLRVLGAAGEGVAGQRLFRVTEVEKFVDVGPYFFLLSAESKVEAREDWFDAEFFRRLLARIDRVRLLQADDPLALDCIALVKQL